MIVPSLNRRGFLQGSAAVGVLAAVAPRLAFGQDQKILRVRSYSDLQVLDPAYRLSAPEDDITDCVLPKLIEWKPGDKWEWQPSAAESIEAVDDTHIKFKLKPDLTWTNGFGPVTADDVKFSFERIADPANESPYKDDWSALDHVEIDPNDPLSGTIILKNYFAPLWSTTLAGGSGKIISRKAVEALPEKKFTTEIPAAAGPYVIKEWLPKQRTVLARNPEWKGEAHYYDEIHVIPIEDEKIAEAGFQAGDIDYTQVSLSSLAEYKKSPPKDATIIERPSLAYVWLGMNVENPALQDERVRRAIQKGIDIDAVLDAAYFGQAERATGIIAPGMPGHREKSGVERDVEGAKKLLQEAGASDLKLKLTLLNKAERLAAAQVIQANLADIGVQVELEPLDSGTFWTAGDQKANPTGYKDLQLLLSRFSMNPDPSWATMWFTPDQIGVWNWERWNNEEFGTLHQAMLSERDDSKRDEAYKRMQDMMENSGAYVFLTHEANASIVKNNIEPALRPDGRALICQFRAKS